MELCSVYTNLINLLDEDSPVSFMNSGLTSLYQVEYGCLNGDAGVNLPLLNYEVISFTGSGLNWVIYGLVDNVFNVLTGSGLERGRRKLREGLRTLV